MVGNFLEYVSTRPLHINLRNKKVLKSFHCSIKIEGSLLPCMGSEKTLQNVVLELTECYVELRPLLPLHSIFF